MSYINEATSGHELTLNNYILLIYKCPPIREATSVHELIMKTTSKPTLFIQTKRS